jgi:hypothetical protein
MWLFKQNIFKLRRIIEEVITYFSVMFSTAVTSDVCSSTFRLTVLPFSTSSVILVTDNVTKAAQVGIQMELTKHIGTEMLLVNFRLALLSIVLNSQAVACTLLLQDLLKLQSLYRLH